jgi:hypothetical protein
MKADPLPNPRKSWNDQHAILRRLLLKDKDYTSALPIFLSHHGMVHSAKLRAGVWSFQDEILKGITLEQLRYCSPRNPHSAAWKIWHIARIEDVTMNLLLADSAQVLHSGGWPDKLEITAVSVGNEMSDEEIVGLSESINVKAVLDYRLAVGKRTRSLVRRLKADLLWQPPTPDRLQRLFEEGAVIDRTTWLRDYWGGHLAANLLLMPASRHCLVHLNEIERMRSKLKRLSAKGHG